MKQNQLLAGITALILAVAAHALPSLASVEPGTWAAQFDDAMRLRAEGKLNDAVAVLQTVLCGPIIGAGITSPAAKDKDQASGNETVKRPYPDRNQYGETLYACYSLYMMQNDWQSAADMFRRAVSKDNQEYPGHLADVASDNLELGNCYYQMKDFKKAADYCERALKLRKTVYGEDSPYIGEVQWRYARALRAQGHWRDASRLVDQSYATLPICGHCRTNEGVCPVYYGEKTFVVSAREFVRLDYFDGGKKAEAGSPRFWCTHCNRMF